MCEEGLSFQFLFTYISKNRDLWSEVACYLELPGPILNTRSEAVEYV
jgi:hypothetical protein